MARLGDTYRGPRMPLWRRLALRHSHSAVGTLADCKGVRRDGEAGQAQVYCGESFSDGSYSGDAGNFGGSQSSGGGGCGSGGGSDGDGGSGCGSGCGGGGD